MFSSPASTSSYALNNLQRLVSAFGLGNVIATGFTIFVVVVTVIIYKLREVFGENNHIEEKSTPSTSPNEHQCQRFSLAEIKSATQDFNEELVVGKGGFGKVYKGFIKNREEVVAVKRLSSGSKQGEDEFRMEIETLSRLRHLHLVSLIGYCNEGNERILIYEYMPGGTLVDHLYKTKAADHTLLSWEKRLEICIGAARGLDYLHTGTAPGVIHRDVKDSNILLDDKLVAKIADFGLAKLENIDQLQSHVSTNVKGTFGYMDPEYFLTRRVSKKTDVYAFGVVLLVVLSGRPAVDMGLGEDQQSLVLWAKKCIEEGRVDKILDFRLKLEIQSNISVEEFIDVVKNCLHKQPKERPSMAQVVAKLELALEHQQQGSLSSAMYFKLNDILKSPVFDETDHEGPTSSLWIDLSTTPPNERSIGDGDATSPKLERSKNDSSTQQRSAWEWLWKGFQKKEKPYKSQNIVCSDESTERSTQQKSTWQWLWGGFQKNEKLYKSQNVVCSDEPSKISQSPSFNQSIRIFSFSELVVATNNFRDFLQTGEDSTGDSYKGYLAEPIGDEALVVVKRRRPEIYDLQNELRLLKSFSHPNLLNLMGYCCENDEFLFVHEFMKNSSLDKHLFFQRDSAAVQLLSWGLRINICSDVARGLAFMHSQEIPIIHRDIKPSKIMLDESYNGKVSGFGLARFGPTGTESMHVSTRVMGTFGYAAPEYMATGHLSTKSDVYSFGVILVEMLTGLRSLDDERSTEQRNLINWTKPLLSNKKKLRFIIDPWLEGEYSMEEVVVVAQLASKCLNAMPKMRPSMRKVLQTLENIQSTNKKT